MKYTLPDLPYDYSALEPHISAEIMQLHHSKHHKTYVDKLNEACEKYAEAESKNDIQAMITLQSAIKFNGGGHINHSIFWKNLSPNGKERPEGALLKMIERDFTTFEKFKEKFINATVGIQGSGWGWLTYCPQRDLLLIATCANQDPVAATGVVPLLGIDVWEHAYYLQYKNVRPDYVKTIMNHLINWEDVEHRLKSGQAVKA